MFVDCNCRHVMKISNFEWIASIQLLMDDNACIVCKRINTSMLVCIRLAQCLEYVNLLRFRMEDIPV